jgi:hypothetical protein
MKTLLFIGIGALLSVLFLQEYIIRTREPESVKCDGGEKQDDSPAVTGAQYIDNCVVTKTSSGHTVTWT